MTKDHLETYREIIRTILLNTEPEKLDSTEAAIKDLEHYYHERFCALFEAHTKTLKDAFRRVAATVENEEDPTPWCHICGAAKESQCQCGPYAANH